MANFYPFGMEQPGRTWQAGDYRYGYNGMERDDNLKGQGNSYTTPFRLNDPRLAGRWWSTDPITKPWESPYAGYGNNPVSFIDPLGLDIFTDISDWFTGTESNSMEPGKIGALQNIAVFFENTLLNFILGTSDSHGSSLEERTLSQQLSGAIPAFNNEFATSNQPTPNQPGMITQGENGGDLTYDAFNDEIKYTHTGYFPGGTFRPGPIPQDFIGMFHTHRHTRPAQGTSLNKQGVLQHTFSHTIPATEVTNQISGVPPGEGDLKGQTNRTTNAVSQGKIAGNSNSPYSISVVHSGIVIYVVKITDINLATSYLYGSSLQQFKQDWSSAEEPNEYAEVLKNFVNNPQSGMQLYQSTQGSGFQRLFENPIIAR